jgi:hypothetical protein
MTRVAIAVEHRARKQAVSILEADDLAAVQVPGQDQVIPGVANGFPDSRVVSAQHADMPVGWRRGVGA